MDGGRGRPKLAEGRLAAALAYGGKVPIDITVLQAAEAWGTAPWEIEDAAGGVRWLKLFRLYRAAHARAQKIARAAPPED